MWMGSVGRMTTRVPVEDGARGFTVVCAIPTNPHPHLPAWLPHARNSVVDGKRETNMRVACGLTSPSSVSTSSSCCSRVRPPWVSGSSPVRSSTSSVMAEASTQLYGTKLRALVILAQRERRTMRATRRTRISTGTVLDGKAKC